MARLFAGTPLDRPPRCERCGQLEADCGCPPPEPAPPSYVAPQKQTAQLVVEKRKRGKTVTVIRNLAPEDNDLPALLTRLKTVCGAGGTIQQETMEIQGNHRQRIRAELEALGYKVR